MTENPNHPVEVTEAHLEFLQVFWASLTPLDSAAIAERVNAVRSRVGKPQLERSTVSVTLGHMRDRKLIQVFRPDKSGQAKLVPETQVSEMVLKRDGKTTYGAAVKKEQVVASKRSAPSDEKTAERWLKHEDQLLKDLQKPVLAGEPDTLTLPNLYVPPLAYVVEGDEDAPHAGGERKQVRRVVNLLGDMLEWANAETVSHPVRILSGDPGCGKSSFARMFAKTLIEQGRAGGSKFRVLFVPIHHLSVKVSPREALASVADRLGYPADVLDPHGTTESVVLILDGLDELAIQGGDEVRKRFIDGVRQAIEACAKNNRRIRVLMCGRPITAQQARESFQDPDQMFHLIPYLPPPEDNINVKYEGVSLEDHDQRGQWWANYSKWYNESKPAVAEPAKMPPVLGHKRLTAFTAQPLLLLLLAIAYRDRDKEPAAALKDQPLPPNPFQGGQLPERMADVLAWLVGRVYVREAASRQADDRAEKLPEFISYVNFRDLLGLLGLAAWHTGGRVATVHAVEQLAEPLSLTDVLEDYRTTVKAGTVGLFVEFYTRHTGRLADAQEAFEFTVKPFGEYLAAVGLVAAIADCTNRLGRQKVAGRRAPWTARDLLFELLRITGPGVLTAEVYEHLCNEVSRRVQQDGSPDLARNGRITFTTLLNECVNVGLPAHDLEGMTFREMSAHSDRTEHAILCLLGACVPSVTPPPPRYPENPTPETLAQRSRDLETWRSEHAVRIDWPSNTAAADFVRRVRKQQAKWWERTDPLPLQAFDLRKQWLQGCDLTRASLDGASLDGASLNGASLDEARLDGASLVGASLDGARLIGAILDRARLDRASLDGAILVRASLDGAILVRASLDGAFMGGVRLDTPEGHALLRKRGAFL